MADVTYTIHPDTISKFMAGQSNSINEHMVKIAEAVKEEARRQSPVDTGYMKAHINVHNNGTEVQVVSEADYSSYVHWGTVHQSPNPFMQRAYDIIRAALRAGTLR